MTAPAVHSAGPELQAGRALLARAPLRRLAELPTLLVLLAVAVRFRLVNLEHFTGSFDEGIRMEQLLLMELGFRPFRDIFASQGPLLLDLLYPFYVAFGRTIGAARLGVSILSLLGVVGAWWSLRPLHPLAGVGAALLLVLSPGYLEGSRLALAEVPSLAPCLWAVGCAIRWALGGRPAWLYAAVVLGTLGILVKPMALPIVAPLALIVVLRRPFRPADVAGALALAAVVTLGILAALDLPRVLEVLGAYRGGAQGRLGSDAVSNIALIRKLLGVERLGFLVVPLVGVAAGFYLCPRLILALLAWPLAHLALFLAYTDLADKHVVYVVPPLALLGGLAIGGVASAMLSRSGTFPGSATIPATPTGGRRDGGAPRATRDVIAVPLGLRSLPSGLNLALAGCGLVACVVYAVSLPAVWRADQALLRDEDERARRDEGGIREQAALMAAIVPPDAFVLTDQPIAAFDARRPVPPWLVDTSGTRIDAGSLTSEVAIREAERYRPLVVVTNRRRLGKLEGFNRWLAADYRLIKTYPATDPPFQLYVRAELETAARSFLERSAGSGGAPPR